VIYLFAFYNLYFTFTVLLDSCIILYLILRPSETLVETVLHLSFDILINF